MDRCDRAWAAGFFDGEGWANKTGGRKRRTRQPYAQINQAGENGAPEVLLRFRDIVGVGRVALADAETNLYRWTASSRGDVARTYETVVPWVGPVKRAQFEHALSVPSGTHEPETLQPAFSEELAWAAGLFDGEGSTYLLRHGSHVGYYVIETAVTQSGAETPEVLVRFRRLAAAGVIYGPLKQPRSRQLVFRWKCHRRIQIELLLSQLWPWLGSVKRDQAERALAVVRSQAALARGNPAWGSHKTHCIRGHEYATARLRPFVSRRGGVQRRDSKQCLVCVRDQARARRQGVRA